MAKGKGFGEENSMYKVEKIIDKRVNKGIIEYKVKWVGWSVNSATWEPEENVANVNLMVKEFNKKLKLEEILNKNNDTMKKKTQDQSKKKIIEEVLRKKTPVVSKVNYNKDNVNDDDHNDNDDDYDEPQTNPSLAIQQTPTRSTRRNQQRT